MSESLTTWELGIAYGKDIERERIIALLNDRARALGECPCDDNCEIVRAGVLLAIGDIALINGEN